jgi:hypothetical protein
MAPTDPRIGCLRVHRMTLEPRSPLSARSRSGTRLGVRPLCSLLATCRCGRAPEQRGDLSVAHGARKLCGGCARRITECPCRTYECIDVRDDVARCRRESEGGIHTRHGCIRRSGSAPAAKSASTRPLCPSSAAMCRALMAASAPAIILGPVRCCASDGRTYPIRHGLLSAALV